MNIVPLSDFQSDIPCSVPGIYLPRGAGRVTLETTAVKLLTMGFLRSSGDHVSPTVSQTGGEIDRGDDRCVSRYNSSKCQLTLPRNG